MSRRKNIMLAYPFEEKRLNKWGFPVLIQPKFDGIRCRALFTSQGVDLLSSEENSLNFAVPHIADILWSHRLTFITRGIFELDGELYNHALPFEAITSITGRTKERHPDYESMQFHIFDHPCVQTPYTHRKIDVDICLDYIFSHWLQKTPTMPAHSLAHVEEYLDLLMASDYEGLIARHPDYPYERKRSTGMMKWKPRKSDKYTIVDYTEEIDKNGEPKGRLGAFFVRDESDNIFKVGTGFSDHQRVTYWDQVNNLIGKNCIIKYQHTTEKGVPRFPVFDVLVEE